MKRLKVILALLVGLAGPAFAKDIKPHHLHRYVSGHTAWNTNAFWLEGTDGVVLVDALLLTSDARRLALQIKASGKPLKGVIITHPHLDHFGGLPTLRDELGDFPVYATEETANQMATTHQQMLQYFPMPNSFGEALDDRMVEATNLIKDGEILTVAGIDFLVHNLGAGEAANNVALYQKDLNAVFAGDTFYPYTHYYVGEGNIEGVLGHLAQLKSLYGEDARVFSGHSDPYLMTSADSQISYIETLMDLVEEARAVPGALGANGYLTPDRRAGVITDMKSRFPGYSDFGFGVDAILTYNIMGAETALIRKGQE